MVWNSRWIRMKRAVHKMSVQLFFLRTFDEGHPLYLMEGGIGVHEQGKGTGISTGNFHFCIPLQETCAWMSSGKRSRNPS